MDEIEKVFKRLNELIVKNIDQEIDYISIDRRTEHDISVHIGFMTQGTIQAVAPSKPKGV